MKLTYVPLFVAPPQDMGSRHRVRAPQVQIIKTATVPASRAKREQTLQFLNSKIKFPLLRKLARPSAPEYKTTFKAKRPNIAVF